MCRRHQKFSEEEDSHPLRQLGKFMRKTNPILILLPFWLFVFFFKFGAGLHYTLLSFLGEQILPIWIVGIVVGTASLLQLIFDVPAGFILDRFGYVKILRLATLVFFFAALALLFGLSLTTFLITVFLGFVGWLFYQPGINAYILVSAKNDEGGKYMGLQHTFSSLGVVCAAAILVLTLKQEAPTIGLIISGILLVALVMAMKTKPDYASVHETSHPWKHYYIRRQFLSKVLKAVKRLNPASTMLAVQNFAAAVFYAMIWFTVPLVIVHQKNSGALSFGLAVFDLAVVILGAYLGRLADRYHKKTLVFIGLFVFAVSGLFLGFNLNILFIFLGFLATAGDEMSSVSLWSWLERLDKKHSEDGLVNGAIILFEDLGWTIGPVMAGFLYGFVGPSLTITIGALPILLTWLFAVVFLRQKTSPELIPASDYIRKPIRHRHKK